MYQLEIASWLKTQKMGCISAYQAGGVTVLIPDIKPATAQMLSQADYIYASLADVLADLDCLMR